VDIWQVDAIGGLVLLPGFHRRLALIPAVEHEDLLIVLSELVEGLIHLQEQRWVVLLYEHLDRSLDVGVGVEHAQTLNLPFRQLPDPLFLLSEEAHLPKRVGFLQAESNVIDGDADVRWVYARNLDDLIKNLILLEVFLEGFHHFFMLFLFNIVGKLLHELIQLPGPHPIDQLQSLLELLFAFIVGRVLLFQDSLVDILHLFNDTVVEP
jgi:hypothetical protein